MGDMADDYYDLTLRAECFYEDLIQWINYFEKELELRKENKHLNKEWTMGNGSTIFFKDMTDKHILNCIKFLKRHME